MLEIKTCGHIKIDRRRSSVIWEGTKSKCTEKPKMDGFQALCDFIVSSFYSQLFKLLKSSFSNISQAKT